LTLAERTKKIQPSQTLAITSLVDSLRRNGRQVIDLGAGEPDFDTPDEIKEAGIRAIREGFTHYTPAAGVLELKEAICDRLNQDHGFEYKASEVVVTCGAKHAIVNVLLALCGRGDEVIVPAPYWTSYLEQVRFVESEPVILATDEQTEFKISPKQLQDAITDKTKLLMLNSPSNPTGSVYTESELKALIEVARSHDLLILYDEIYDKIIYDDQLHVNPAAFPEMRDRVITVNGVSKAFAMTGWRIGYLAATEEIAKAAAKIQSHTTSNPCSISQQASIAALKADSTIYKDMVREFDRRRKYLMEQLTGIPRIECTLPKGAFYAFPKVSGYFGLQYNDSTLESSMDICSFLLEECGVAVVPGEAFGSPNHVRISYATSMDNLQDAVNRMERAFRKLLD